MAGSADEFMTAEEIERAAARELSAIACDECRYHVYCGYLYSACHKHQHRCRCSWCEKRRRGA